MYNSEAQFSVETMNCFHGHHMMNCPHIRGMDSSHTDRQLSAQIYVTAGELLQFKQPLGHKHSRYSTGNHQHTGLRCTPAEL
jgi:hypothetical protein